MNAAALDIITERAALSFPIGTLQFLRIILYEILIHYCVCIHEKNVIQDTVFSLVPYLDKFLQVFYFTPQNFQFRLSKVRES